MAKPESLVRQGVDRIKSGGEPAATVAASIISASWETMSDSARRHFAVRGLASLINDQMSADRAAEAAAKEAEMAELLRPYRQAREEAERAETERLEGFEKARKEREAREAEILKDAPPLQEVIEDVHARFHCTSRSHTTYGLRHRCVFFWCHGDPRLLAKEKLEEVIDRLRGYAEEERSGLRRIVDVCMQAGYQQALNNMRSIMLVSADGSMKSLAMFNAEDIRKWKSKSRASQIAWRKRRKFFERADSMLAEHDVEALDKLPAECVRELAETAEAIWKKAGKKQEATA